MCSKLERSFFRYGKSKNNSSLNYSSFDYSSLDLKIWKNQRNGKRGILMKLNLGYLRISSPAFGPLERIPKSYAYDGDNLSPPLEWSNAPADTQEFALICFDPDAPLPYGFTH
jgi:hypothetical protein